MPTEGTKRDILFNGMKGELKEEEGGGGRKRTRDRVASGVQSQKAGQAVRDEQPHRRMFNDDSLAFPSPAQPPH